jgi:hypothetical protein
MRNGIADLIIYLLGKVSKKRKKKQFKAGALEASFHS